ncbi:MAG: MBL fold metallo-hydrolase [Anaerolineales bacterium]|nr:MAG: MBL fold metallo-hydrolase [Anaerolineales bacterium]
MEIIPNVHRIPLITANVYLIIEEDGLTLIDSAMQSSVKKILSYIRSCNQDPTQLKYILLTHADIDHGGGAKALKVHTGAKVCASKIAAGALAEGKSSRELRVGRIGKLVFSFMHRVFSSSMIMDVDEVLSPGQTLPILGGIEVIDTQGHTPGHISFYAKETGLLFAGDSLITRTGKINLNISPAITWDREKTIASTRRQAELKPKAVCSGHGPVVFEPEVEFPY